jgi:hypothetical protein
MADTMTDINKVPDASIIAERIFAVMSLGDIERELIGKILNAWNEEWIEYVAENETGKSDNTEKARKRDNAERLKIRVEKLSGDNSVLRFNQMEDPGF